MNKWKLVLFGALYILQLSSPSLLAISDTFECDFSIPIRLVSSLIYSHPPRNICIGFHNSLYQHETFWGNFKRFFTWISPFFLPLFNKMSPKNLFLTSTPTNSNNTSMTDGANNIPQTEHLDNPSATKISPANSPFPDATPGIEAQFTRRCEGYKPPRRIAVKTPIVWSKRDPLRF